MQWSYDKNFKQWYTLATNAAWEDGYTISRVDGLYKLELGYLKTIGRFKKLSSAKTVAELLRNG